MKNTVKKTLINSLVKLESKGINLLSVPSIKPDKRTLQAFEILKQIYTRAEKTDLKIWIAGSWAAMGASGKFIKNTNDIDITVRTLEDEERLMEIVVSLGFRVVGHSRLLAIRCVGIENDIQIDFASITNPKSHFYNIHLSDEDFGLLDGFTFRIVPKASLVEIYKKLVLDHTRNTKEDLVKLKAFASK